MFHSKKLNNRINNVHERALIIAFRDYELIAKAKKFRNLQILAKEIFKTKNGVKPIIMEDVFKFKNLIYNFRNAETLNRSNVNFVNYGTETMTSLGAKI